MYALKIIEKKRSNAQILQNMYREVSIMQKLSHPGIVNLHEFIDTPDFLYLVMVFDLI